MTRITKDIETRKIEIIDAARELFYTKGYEKTSVNDIVLALNISKGLFYYYFKSKEEILDTIIDNGISNRIEDFLHIVNDSKMNALDKLKNIFLINLRKPKPKNRLLDYLHKEKNVILHQKSIVKSVIKNTPVISRVIEQGCAEGVFHVRHPYETTEFLLVGMNFLYDPSIFNWSREELQEKFSALGDILQKVLGAAPESFAFIKDFTQNIVEGRVK